MKFSIEYFFSKCDHFLLQGILKLNEDVSSSKINFPKSQGLWAGTYKYRIDQPGQMKWWWFSLIYLELTLVTLFSITPNGTNKWQHSKKNPYLEQSETLLERGNRKPNP